MCICRTDAPHPSPEAAAEATPEAGHAATAEAAAGQGRPAASIDPSLLLLAVGLASGQISRAGQMGGALALALLQCMASPLQAVGPPPLLSPLSHMACCRL